MTIAMFACDPGRVRANYEDQARRDERIRREKSRTYYSSKSTWLFNPKHKENLQTIDVAGAVLFRNAPKLKEIKSNGLVLIGSPVSQNADAGYGNIKCVKSDVKGILQFCGRNAFINGAKIGVFKVQSRDVTKGFPRDGKQIVRIENTILQTLQILNGKLNVSITPDGTPLNIIHKSSDGKFELHLKNVTVESVTRQ